jgi:hypothetical protein
MPFPRGQEIIEQGQRENIGGEGSCTDLEYYLSIELQKSVDLLQEMLETFSQSENEITFKAEKFLEAYKT